MRDCYNKDNGHAPSLNILKNCSFLFTILLLKQVTSMHSSFTDGKLRLVINGKTYLVHANANETLAELLRYKLRLTGTKIGCESGECGACTVIIDGRSILSCLTFAVDCQEREIVTVEGLENSETGELHPIQKAFVKYHGLQCGYCTPGMIMSAKALLDKKLAPTEEDIRAEINGNICRCTGYISITKSILAAAEMMREQSHD